MEEHRRQCMRKHRAAVVLLVGAGHGQRLIPPPGGDILRLGSLAEEEVLHYEGLHRREDAARATVPLPEAPLCAGERAELKTDVKPPLHIWGLRSVPEKEPQELGRLWATELELSPCLIRRPRLPALLLRRGGTWGRLEEVLRVLARKGTRPHPLGRWQADRLGRRLLCAEGARPAASVLHGKLHCGLQLLLLRHLRDVHDVLCTTLRSSAGAALPGVRRPTLRPLT
mmetsp:Transcript_15482/g.34386  ORF Transcript_15482/g.34386 Transcript_15482/m.34386 type:complete len:227 (+) Transcript_15482:1129-1809(+)